MDPQLLAVVLVIATAGIYLLHSTYRGWRRLRQGQCSSTCGCPSKPKPKATGIIESNDLTSRLRAKRHA